MARLIAYAIHVQNFIFLNFLKNEILSILKIWSIFFVIIFFDNFVFLYLLRKIIT